jgi:anti-sigma B factor antagonist
VQLGLDSSTRGDATVLTVTGELDLANAPAFRQRIVDLVAHDVRRIVVDLGALDYLDSAGLGMIVAAYKRVRTHGGALAIACDEPRILKPFEITDLGRVLAIAPTVGAALELLAAPDGPSDLASQGG